MPETESIYGPLNIFIARMNKIGVKLTFIGNVPWVYLDTVNGNKVKEQFESDHAFTIYFVPVMVGKKPRFTDLKEIFKIIRKYR